ncbi:ribonuclease H-like domain-containing protein [Pilobolus umbonatus]|nr:ribonuclease H-like domain-containing protein [Pilobolus umbonatus]
MTDLKSIAVHCGITSSGTKPHLIDKLVTHLTESGQMKVNSPVLSIDLGYRNFAYCYLSGENEIIDWNRVDFDLPSFHPSVVAPVVRTFIKDRIVTHLKGAGAVIVEQQRARSNGAHTVLETTLRVNAVEGILWTGLYEAVESVDKKNMLMVPLIRQLVDKAWEDELNSVAIDNQKTLSKLKSKYNLKKQTSALLVQKWLDENKDIQCDTEFKNLFESAKKKDDLSDCLIQAVAWNKWKKNTLDFINRIENEQNDII